MSRAVDDITSSREKSLANLKKFQKGVSGNPAGRAKKVKEIDALAKKNSEKALRKLVALIDSNDDRVALSAAQAILDRAVGKPKQSVDIKPDVTHHGSEPVSDTARWIEETLRTRADRQAEKPLPN